MATMPTDVRTRRPPAASTERKVAFIVLLFVLIAVLLGGLIHLQGRLLDGVRAYTRGEGIWAKAQKDAVLHLSRYAYSHADKDYQQFQEAIQVNLGDQRARLALLQSPPDKEAAGQALLRGGNDPQDVDALIWFFLNFRNVSYLRDAISIWEAGDRKIAELAALAQDIHRAVRAGDGSAPPMDALLSRLQGLDAELLALENEFSRVLGQGARWVRRVAWQLSAGVLLAIVALAVLVSRQIIKSIVKSERRLLASESRFRSLTDSNTIGIVSWHLDGRITLANRLFLDMLGYEDADLAAGRINWRELTPPESRARDDQALRELLDSGRCSPYEKALLHRSGQAVPVYLGASLLDDGQAEGVAFVVDLRERKRFEEQFQLAATVFAASSEGILITDASLRVVSSNPALHRLLGCQEQDLLGCRPHFLMPAPGLEEGKHPMWNALEHHGCWQGEFVDVTKDGTRLPLRLSVSSVSSGHTVTHYVVIVADNSAHKAAEEHLRHLAHHDMLTGLPNRVLFHDRLEHLIRRGAGHGDRFALLFYDLNNFKPVNDRYGHEVGDKLLQLVAARLTHDTRETEMVTRLGGDEFVLLLEQITDRRMVDAVVANTVASLRRPYHINGHVVDIGVSVGVSIYPDDGTSAAALLHQADTAMYSMKNDSRQAATSRPAAG